MVKTALFRNILILIFAGSLIASPAVVLSQAVSHSDASVSVDPAKPYLTVAQLRAKYGDPAGRIADIDGADIYYKDEGKGPVILMVHGSVSSLRTYDRIAAVLKARYRVIRYDIPGYGLSGRVTDAVAEKVKPTDIAEKLLERLGVKSATVVGVSSGGTLGMYLAAKRPDMVERLILSNTPADPVSTDHLVATPSWQKALDDAKSKGFQDPHYWSEYLTFFAGDPARISQRTRLEYYDFNRRVPEKYPITLVARIGDGKQAIVEMAKVTAPTLLIWGGRDKLLTPASADRLAGFLKAAQVSKIFMPDVGHYPPLESPDRFAQLIAAFIEAATPALPTGQP